MLALDDGDDFLQSTNRRFRCREHFYLPVLRFGVTGVHAEDLRRKQGSFIASGARADFKDHVLLVVGILGQKQDLQLFFYTLKALFELGQLFLRVGEHVGIALVGQHGLAFPDAASQVLVLTILLNDRQQVAVRLRGLLVALRVGDDVRRRKSTVQLFVLQFGLF